MSKKSIVLYLTLGILCFFLACLSTNYDYDLFARLIVGERFIENSILPFKDFLSYTPTHAWYDHEWGSGVIFYLVLKYLGAGGLLLLQSVLMFFIAFFVIKTQKLQKHSFPTSIIFMALFLILIYRLNTGIIRCQLFSFTFFSMFLYFLEKTRKTNTNIIWLIPPIIILWNNLHGGVVSGLGLIFLYLIGSLFEKKDWKKYFSVLAASLPLLIINPYGYKYLSFLFSAATMQRKYVVEWWSIFSPYHFKNLIAEGGFGITAFILNFRSKKIDITKTIVLLVTLYLGFAHVKLLSLTVIAAASLCYNDFVKIFIKFKNLLKKIERSIYPAIWILAVLIPLFSPTVPRADFKRYPLMEVEYLKLNKIKGNIVVPFGYGSYVSYKLYPDNLIYMDGRYEEVYNNKEFLTLREYELGEENWRDIVNNYPTDILMPKKTTYIYSVLKQDKDWVEVFNGRLCSIFLKKDSKYLHYDLAPTKDINYYRKKMFKGEE